MLKKIACAAVLAAGVAAPASAYYIISDQASADSAQRGVMFQRGDTSYEYVIPDAFQSGPRIYSYVTFDYPFRFKIYWMGGTSAEDTYVIAESEDTVRPWTSHSAILTEPLYSIRYELIQPPANPIYGPGRGYFYVFNTNPSPTVPEPAAWAMMIAGFGLVGLASRRRRKIATAAG